MHVLKSLSDGHLTIMFGETDILVWKRLLSNYQKVFSFFCDNNPKKKDLKQLESWYVRLHIIYFFTFFLFLKNYFYQKFGRRKQKITRKS